MGNKRVFLDREEEEALSVGLEWALALAFALAVVVAVWDAFLAEEMELFELRSDSKSSL